MLKRGRARILALLLSAFFIAATIAPCVFAAPGSGGGRIAKEYELGNGLKVVLLEDRSYPVVSTFIWYHVGARNEPAGETGISHVLEHLLFQNVGTLQKGAMSVTLARNGAQFNGYTSDDFTTFYEVVHPCKLDLALKLEAARMRSATFSAADLKEEVERVERELDSEAKDPAAALAREVRASAFRQHPYRNPVSGWRYDLDGMSVQDVKAFYDRYYYPNNASLVIVGNFQTDETRSLIDKYFGALPKSPGELPVVRVTEGPQTAEHRVFMRHPGKKETALVAYHAPKYAEADAPVMVVLEKLLNGGYSGRLKTKLIDTKTCSSARCAFQLQKDPGLFNVTLNTYNAVPLQKALDSWDAAINQLKTQPISDSELRRAKSQAEFALVNDQDGPYRMGFHLGYCDSLLSWQSAFDWLNRLQSVTAADVERVSRRYFGSESRVVGFLASTAPNTVKQPQTQPVPRPPATKQTPEAEQPGGLHSPYLQSNDFGHAKLYAYLNGPRRFSNSIAQLDMDGVSESILDQPAGVKLPGAKGTAPASVKEKAPPKPLTNKSLPTATVPSNADLKPGNKEASTAGSARSIPMAGGTADGTTTVPNAAGTTGSAALPVNASTASGAAPSPTETSGGSSASGSTPLSIDTGTASGTTDVSLPLKERTLSNGIKVIVFESHMTPLVQMSGAIKAGEALEQPGKRGAAQVLSSCFNNGNTKIGKNQLQSMQEDLGLTPEAMLRFEAEPQYITFQTRCLSRDIARQIGTLSQIMRDPAVSDADIEHAKQDASSHVKHAGDSTSSRVDRAFLRSILSPTSVYCPPDTAELLKSVSALKAPDIKEFMSFNVAPEACTIAFAGDIDLDLAAHMVEQAFSGWSKAGSYKARPLPEAQQNPRHVLKSSITVHDKSKNLVCVGKLLPINLSDQRYSYLLISDCAFMNHPLFGRLIQRMNEEPGLAQALMSDEVETKLSNLSSSTVWSVSLPVEPSVVPRATGLVQSELKQFGRNGLGAAELAEAKRYLVNALPVKDASNTHVVIKTCLSAALAGARPDFFATQLSDIQNASLEAVNRFVRTDFKPDQSTLVVAGNKQSIKGVHGVSTLLPTAATQTAASERGQIR